MPQSPGPRPLGVVVTRPQTQAIHLCQALERLGHRVIAFPVLAVEPIPAQVTLPPDLLLFVSTNAVRHGLPVLRRAGLPGHAGIGAVGRATARALGEQGLQPTLVPEQRFDSEGLLSLQALQHLDDKRVLIVRGQGGRETLAGTLRQRGAQVAYLEVYRRLRPDRDPTPLLAAWRAGEVDLVTVTSGEALDNLLAMIGPEGRKWLCSTPVLVFGKRLAERARQQGLTRVSVTRENSDQGILEALALQPANRDAPSGPG